MNSFVSVEFVPYVVVTLIGGLVAIHSKSVVSKLLLVSVILSLPLIDFYLEYNCDRGLTNVVARFAKGDEACPTPSDTLDRPTQPPDGQSTAPNVEPNDNPWRKGKYLGPDLSGAVYVGSLQGQVIRLSFDQHDKQLSGKVEYFFENTNALCKANFELKSFNELLVTTDYTFTQTPEQSVGNTWDTCAVGNIIRSMPVSDIFPIRLINPSRGQLLNMNLFKVNQ